MSSETVNKVKDKYNITLFTFCLIGMAGVQSCFIITANQYWKYKFRDLNHPTHVSYLQGIFTSYFGWAATIAGLLVNVLNVYLIKWFSFNKRLYPAMTLLLLMFISTLSFVNVDTDSWQTGFFIFSVASNLTLSIAGALALGGYFTIQGKFPEKYITALGSGESIGSIVSAILQLISLHVGVSEISTGNVYFACGTLSIIFTYVMFVISSNSEFFKTHLNLVRVEQINGTTNKISWEAVKNITCKIWVLCFACAFTLFLTVFSGPGILVWIKSEDGKTTPWGEKYFTAVALFLNYSVWDWIGKLLSGCFQRPKSSKMMLIISISRLFIVPLLLFSNLDVKDWPVVFPKDYQFIIFVASFAVTSGYVINITCCNLKELVSAQEVELAYAMFIIVLSVTTFLAGLANICLVKSLIS